MGKVQLKLPSWIAAILGEQSSDWLTLEKEIKEVTTISDLLTGLVATYPGFRQAVFDPNAGHLNDQLAVVLNDRLLTFQEVTQTRLTDGDTITLLPLYYGG